MMTETTATERASVPTPWNPPRGFYLLAVTACGVITTVGLRSLSGVLGALFLGFVLVVVVSPLPTKLRARGAPSWLALASGVAAAVGILATIVLTVGFAVIRFVDYARSADYTALANEIDTLIADWSDRLGVEGQSLDTLLNRVDVWSLAGNLAGQLSGVVGIAGTAFSAVLFVLFMSMDRERFMAQFLQNAAERRPSLTTALDGFVVNTRRYFVVNTIFGLVVAGLDVLVLFAFGVPLALIWGLLSFMSSFIPNVGFVIGLIPPALLVLALHGPWAALALIAIYFVINTVVDSGLKPKFVGDAVGLSATVTFLSLLYWSWVLGPLGAVLAVPLTLFAKALLIDSDPQATWAQSLISLSPGEDAPGDHATHRHPARHDPGAGDQA